MSKANQFIDKFEDKIEEGDLGKALFKMRSELSKLRQK